MIVFDTETTGLISNTLLPLRQQPRIIELFCLKLDDVTMEPVDELELLFNPGAPLEEIITQITGITDAMLKDEPTWAAQQDKIVEFFFAQRRMAAHNLSFDRDLLTFELRRTDSERKFPWPPEHICTVEATEHLHGKRLNLTALHVELFGEGFPEAHRARNDVMALSRCYVELVKREIIKPVGAA